MAHDNEAHFIQMGIQQQFRGMFPAAGFDADHIAQPVPPDPIHQRNQQLFRLLHRRRFKSGRAMGSGQRPDGFQCIHKEPPFYNSMTSCLKVSPRTMKFLN